MDKKFETLGDLIEQASVKCGVKIQDKTYIRLHNDKNQKIGLPFGYVYLAAPSENYIGIFTSGATDDFMKICGEFMTFTPQITMKFVPESIENTEFYYWPLLLGFDQSHHGFTQWTAMLIEAGFLNENKNKKIKKNKLISKFLGLIDGLPLMQEAGKEDKQFSLEQKIKFAKEYLKQKD